MGPTSTRADSEMPPRSNSTSRRTSPHTSSSGEWTISSPSATSRRPYPQPALTDVRIQSSTAGTDGKGCLFPAGTGGGGCSSSTTTSPLPATSNSRTYLRCVNTVPTYGRLRRDEGTIAEYAINQPISMDSDTTPQPTGVDGGILSQHNNTGRGSYSSVVI